MIHEFKNFQKQNAQIVVEEFINSGNIAIRYYISKNKEPDVKISSLIGLIYQRKDKLPKFMCYCCSSGKQINKKLSQTFLLENEVTKDSFHNQNIQWMLESNYYINLSRQQLEFYGYRHETRDIFSEWQPSMQ